MSFPAWKTQRTFAKFFTSWRRGHEFVGHFRGHGLLGELVVPELERRNDCHVLADHVSDDIGVPGLGLTERGVHDDIDAVVDRDSEPRETGGMREYRFAVR